MIRKFRSIEEMKANRWREPDDPKLPDVWRSMWHRGQASAKRPFKAGVYKYRTYDEAKAQADAWSKERRK
jgi:hypothetical protein